MVCIFLQLPFKLFAMSKYLSIKQFLLVVAESAIPTGGVHRKTMHACNINIRVVLLLLMQTGDFLHSTGQKMGWLLLWSSHRKSNVFVTLELSAIITKKCIYKTREQSISALFYHYNFCKGVMEQPGAAIIRQRIAGYRLHTSKSQQGNQLYCVLLMYTTNTVEQHKIRSQLQLFMTHFFIILMWVCLAAL